MFYFSIIHKAESWNTRWKTSVRHRINLWLSFQLNTFFNNQPPDKRLGRWTDLNVKQLEGWIEFTINNYKSNNQAAAFLSKYICWYEKHMALLPFCFYASATLSLLQHHNYLGGGHAIKFCKGRAAQASKTCPTLYQFFENGDPALCQVSIIQA